MAKTNKKIVSTAMTFVLFGGLLLTSGLEKATAQGSFVSISNENAARSSTENLLQITSVANSSTEQEVKTLPDPLSIQKNGSIIPSTEQPKPNQTLPLQEELSSVSESVYLQTKDYQRATLNILTAVEQLSNQKKKLPNKDAVREMSERRTTNSKHYMLKDGSYQAVITLADQHFEDENGQLQDILSSSRFQR